MKSSLLRQLGDFLLRLTGAREARYPIADAAAIAGRSERSIRRLIERGDLSVAGTDATGRWLVRLQDLEVVLGVPRLRAAYSLATVQEIFKTFHQIEKYLVSGTGHQRLARSEPSSTSTTFVGKAEPAAGCAPERQLDELGSSTGRASLGGWRRELR